MSSELPPAPPPPDHDATLELPRDGSGVAARLPLASDSGSALTPGVRLLEYRIDGVLGEGSFGVTYLATDVHLNAAVAIKEYLPQEMVFRAADGSVSPTASEHMARYRQGLDSFLVEARTLAAFRHRAIVRVARFFEANRTAYMVLEVEQGSLLKAWWPPHRSLGEKGLVELLLPLLDGLAAVHAAGFLHRDIKPDNIQVRDSDGSLVLLDFGSAGQAAAVAANGAVVVTPGYAPIEQYGPGEQGPWTDLYALGATLYWAATGKKPPDAETRKADPRAYRRAVDAGRDEFGDAFLKAIDWALSTDAARRPRDVAEFRRALCADHPASLARFDAQSRSETPAEAMGTAPGRRRGRSQPAWRRALAPTGWPLAVKLTVAMCLAVVLPMTAVAWASLRDNAAALAEGERRYLAQLALRTADRMSTYLADSRGFAHRLAADPAFSSYLQRPAEPARVLVRERLQHYAQSNPDVRQAMLLDAEGTEQVGTDARGAGRSHAMRPYLREALTGRAYTGDVVAGSEERDSGVYCAEPVRAEGGAVVGVLVIRVAAAVLDRQLAEARQDERVTPFLVDADGVFIRHPHADLQYRSLAVLAPDKQAEIRADQRFRRDQITSVDEVELAQALIGAKKAGHLAYDSAVTGRAMLAGYAPVAGHDWVVGVTEPSASAQAALQRTQIWLLAGAGAVGLLATAAAWLLARRIVQPLRALTRAAREVEAGDYTDPHLELDGPDEAGEMTRAFKSMVAALRQRERGRLGPRP